MTFKTVPQESKPQQTNSYLQNHINNNQPAWSNNRTHHSYKGRGNATPCGRNKSPETPPGIITKTTHPFHAHQTKAPKPTTKAIAMPPWPWTANLGHCYLHHKLATNRFPALITTYPMATMAPPWLQLVQTFIGAPTKQTHSLPTENMHRYTPIKQAAPVPTPKSPQHEMTIGNYLHH